MYPVFSLIDAMKVVPDLNRIQLDRWEKKGYLKRIRKGYYCFRVQEVKRDFLYYVANKIYAPSYISLEMALRHYDLIPEEVFLITSVSTKKAMNFTTPVGNFSYRCIKPALFFGYRLVDFSGKKLLLAEPEKAVLDYLYLHPELKTSADFEGMRINVDEFKAQISTARFQKYLDTFGSRALAKRAKVFLTTIYS